MDIVFRFIWLTRFPDVSVMEIDGSTRVRRKTISKKYHLVELDKKVNFELIYIENTNNFVYN